MDSIFWKNVKIPWLLKVKGAKDFINLLNINKVSATTLLKLQTISHTSLTYFFHKSQNKNMVYQKYVKNSASGPNGSLL